jgi:hypothetical protein
MTARPATASTVQLLPPSRYRHPGDVIRLIAGGTVLACAVIALAVASKWFPALSSWLLGPSAPAPSGIGASTVSWALTGIVQVAFVAAAALVVLATLRYRRFRQLGGLAVAAAAAAGIFYE